MELKLQQAIVATRAGRSNIAQRLLTQLIQDNPSDANAWFLLSHLVDSPERRRRYLQKTIDLDPDHDLAKQHLAQLEAPRVPVPVVPEDDQKEDSNSPAAAEIEADSGPASSEKQPAQSSNDAQDLRVNQLPDWLQDLEQKQLNSESSSGSKKVSWSETAGRPVRESVKTVEEDSLPPAPEEILHAAPIKKSSEEVWLIRMLILMVVVAAIVLGILVLVILL